MRKDHLTDSLAQILEVLVQQYAPQRIILFGSMAQRQTHEWSDLDLVIIKESSLPFLQRLKEVALLCPVWVGVDFLVYTPAEFQQMVDEHNPFIINEVLKKGKVLYERNPVTEVAQ